MKKTGCFLLFSFFVLYFTHTIGKSLLRVFDGKGGVHGAPGWGGVDSLLEILYTLLVPLGCKI